MNDTEHEADTAPEGRSTGQGYPEEQPAGAGIDGRDHPENDIADGDDDAPSTSPRRDGDAGQATGNPKAAGSEEDQ